VLGEMLELGADSTAEHDAIGRLAVRLNIDHVIAVGSGARAIELAASHEGSGNGEAQWAADAEGAVSLLEGNLRPRDLVLVKASRGVVLERVAEALLAGNGGGAR